MESSRHDATTLAVIGAGPKGVAIAAKRSVLKRLGIKVPELIVIDPRSVGGHWTGEHGYTDGLQDLGTPPDKDVGFPYASETWEDLSEDVDEAMLGLSWQAFHVIGRRAHRGYAAWVDRTKPQPTHRHWAEYLQWVAKRISLEPRLARLSSIAVEDGRWQLGLDNDDSLAADGLVITGPGPPRRRIPVEGGDDWVFDGHQFWLPDTQEQIGQLVARARQTPITACVIGSGETAAAIVVQLARTLPHVSTIHVMSRQGVTYTRGESFDENQLYSNPEAWRDLPAQVRQEFVYRTDRGVFSVTSKQVLNHSPWVTTKRGSVQKIRAVQQTLRLELAEAETSIGYDLVVDATGFHEDWFVDLMSSEARAALDDALPSEEEDPSGFLSVITKRLPSFGEKEISSARLAAAIGEDLAVEGLQPKLHLPMLAAMRQGPGFPNLSCLGLLSDRILEPHSSVSSVQVGEAIKAPRGG